MEYSEAKQKFILAWGILGSSWGINKAMAQIHALLMIATEPLSTEQVMEELQMSRGNVNMNMRALIDWGIVKKELKVGDRKEYFYSDKDVWELARQVARERRQREIEPILEVLKEVRNATGGEKKEAAEFRKVTSDLYAFTKKLDDALVKFTKAEQEWFYKLIMKL